MRRAALMVCVSLLVTACSGTAVQQGPSDTLRAYAAALREGRIDDAYRLLSAEAKRTMSLEAFRRAVEENPDDAAEIARALARPASDPVVTATVTVPSGDELLMVYEGGRWRIDGAAVDLYSQATPRQALVGFLRAYERGRFDVILRFVPEAEKEGSAFGGGEGDEDAAQQAVALTAEKLKAAWEGPQREQIERIVQAMRAALPNATIEETGDHASMSYGAGGTVSFLREHGVWKIQDF